MMQSAAILENLPYYTNRNGKGNGMQIGKLVLFYALWAFAAASFFTVFILYSPNPFSNFMFKQHYPLVKNTTLSALYSENDTDKSPLKSNPATIMNLEKGATPEDVYTDDLDPYRTFYFPSHDFTLMAYWTTHLHFQQQKIVNGSETAMFDIHLDKIDDNWAQKLPTLDYAIISIGQWFNRKNYLYEGGKVIGCIYWDEPNVPNLGFPFAVGKAMGKALEYINDGKDCKALFTLARTFSPAHFEYGTWNEGGKCNRTSPYTEKQVEYDFQLEVTKSQVKAFEKIKKRRDGKRFEILDITRVMLMRPDGHPDINWHHKYLEGHTDCIHWCLPGVTCRRME